MPIDFSKKGIRFLKYSMPTKASEFMISGTPVLLYADERVSLVSHAQKHGWAGIVSKQDAELLKSEIINLLTNHELRLKLSTTAKKYAIDNFDALIVREQFRKQFCKDL
jgi:glycosyltransferase involved in cell wall biosynthesis